MRSLCCCLLFCRLVFLLTRFCRSLLPHFLCLCNLLFHGLFESLSLGFLVNLLQFILFAVANLKLIGSDNLNRVINLFPIDKQYHILRRNIHEGKQFFIGICRRNLNFVTVLYLVLLCHRNTIYLHRLWKLHLIAIDADRNPSAKFRNVRDLIMRRRPNRRLLQHDDIVRPDIMAEIYFLAIDIHMGALPVLSLRDMRLSIYAVAQLLTASWEQPFPCEIRLYCRIGNSELVIVVQLYFVSIKGNIDKIIILVIVCQADSNRCDDCRIPQRPLWKVNVPHDLLPAQCDTLGVQTKLSGNQVVESTDFTTAANDKHSAWRCAAV